MTVTKRAVDHESYAYQLALDIGAAPTITHMLLNYDMSVVYTWAMSPNFPTKFRLIGPWSSQQTAKEAVDLMGKDGELGKLAHRTGGAVCKYLCVLFCWKRLSSLFSFCCPFLPFLFVFLHLYLSTQLSLYFAQQYQTPIDTF